MNFRVQNDEMLCGSHCTECATGRCVCYGAHAGRHMHRTTDRPRIVLDIATDEQRVDGFTFETHTWGWNRGMDI